MIIWFLGITLPTAFFGGILAVDVSKILIEHRKVSNAVEAAALAGAAQLEPNTYTIDTDEASEKVRYMLDEAQIGAVPVFKSRPTATNVSFEDAYPGDGRTGVTRVTVRVDYDMDLIFYPLLQAVLGDSPDKTGSYSVTRSADVCIPGEYGLTVDSSCTRPQ